MEGPRKQASGRPAAGRLLCRHRYADRAAQRYGDEFVRYLQETYEPIESWFASPSSRDRALNGSGSRPAVVGAVLARQSAGRAYLSIGKEIEAVLREYAEAWLEKKKR